MYCSKCGKEIKDNSNFCKYCGDKINIKQEIEDTANNEFALPENNISKSSNSTNSKHTIITCILVIVIGTIIGLWVVYKNTPDQISTYYATSNKGNSITINNFNDSRFKRTVDSYTKTDGIIFSNKVTAVGYKNTLSYYIVIGWKNSYNYYYVAKMYPNSTGLSQIKYTETAYPKTMTIEEVIEKVTRSLGAIEYCIFIVSNI